MPWTRESRRARAAFRGHQELLQAAEFEAAYLIYRDRTISYFGIKQTAQVKRRRWLERYQRENMKLRAHARNASMG